MMMNLRTSEENHRKVKIVNIFMLIDLKRIVNINFVFVLETNQICFQSVYQKQILFEIMRKMLYSIINQEDLEELKKSGVQPQVNDRRFKEKVDKRNFCYDSLKFLNHLPKLSKTQMKTNLKRVNQQQKQLRNWMIQMCK